MGYEIDTEKVKEAANDILLHTDNNSKYKDKIQKIIKSIENLGTVWVSNSQVKMANSLIASLNSLIQFQTNLNAISKTILDIANRRENLEKQIFNLLNEL